MAFNKKCLNPLEIREGLKQGSDKQIAWAADVLIPLKSGKA